MSVLINVKRLKQILHHITHSICCCVRTIIIIITTTTTTTITPTTAPARCWCRQTCFNRL